MSVVEMLHSEPGMKSPTKKAAKEPKWLMDMMHYTEEAEKKISSEKTELSASDKKQEKEYSSALKQEVQQILAPSVRAQRCPTNSTGHCEHPQEAQYLQRQTCKVDPEGRKGLDCEGVAAPRAELTP